MMRASHPERRTPTIRQFLMVMAAVTWFAVLLPVGARAAGQLVTLVDPTTSTKARVETGALRVAEYNDPARLPVRRAKRVLLAAGVFSGQATLTTVPPGYELVVDTVSVDAHLPIGQRPGPAGVQVHPNGFVFLPLTLNGPEYGQDTYLGTERVQLYADQGYTVVVFFRRGSNTGTADAFFSINGHLVKL